jgi:hypothetical protein
VRRKRDVEVGSHVYHVEGSNKPIIPTGEIFIHFHENVSEEEQKIAIDEYHLELVERRDKDYIVVRVTAKSPNPLKAAQALQNTSLVKHAEPDVDTVVDEYDFVQPDDDLIDHQWH